MSEQFATLMAQVIPVLLLAVVVQGQAQLPLIRRRIRKARKGHPGGLPHSVGLPMLSVLYGHGLVIYALGIAEIFCILRVYKSLAFPSWTGPFVIAAAVISILGLVGFSYFDFVDEHLTQRLQPRGSGFKSFAWWLVWFIPVLIIFMLITRAAMWLFGQWIGYRI